MVVNRFRSLSHQEASRERIDRNHDDHDARSRDDRENHDGHDGNHGHDDRDGRMRTMVYLNERLNHDMRCMVQCLDDHLK